MKKFFLIMGFLLLTAASVACGLGASYPAEVRQGTDSSFKHFIAADGWIEDQSELRLPYLSRSGNRIKIELDPWRPKGVSAAELRIFACGKKIAEYEVNDSSRMQEFAIASDCSPYSLKFVFNNPFQVPSDSRLLGVKLISASVSSRFGLPQLSGTLYAAAFAAAILLGAVYFYAFAGASLRFLAPFVVSIFLGAVLAVSPFAAVEAVYLALLLLLIGFGVMSANWFLEKPMLHESEEGLRAKSEHLILGLLLLLAAALRFYGISFGLPEQYHPDEGGKAQIVSQMLATGDYNPHYFLHPPLLLYFSLFAAKAAALFGFGGEGQAWIILMGRTVSALAGVLSIYFVFLLGKFLFSKKTGLISAALLSVFPLHVACSRYMKEDALFVMGLLLTSAFAAKALAELNRRESSLANKSLFLSGAVAGICAASKYTGVLSLLPALAVSFLSVFKLPNKKSSVFAACLTVFLAVFFYALCAPYSFLSSSEFIEGFAYEAQHMQQGHGVVVSAGAKLWMFHFSNSIIPGMSPLTALLAVIGMGFLLRRRKLSDIALLAMILLFYLPAEWVKAKPPPQPERYILPCLPFLAIALAEALSCMRRKGLCLAAGILLTLAFAASLYRSATLASELKYDTRIQAAQWMSANLPTGAKVLVAGYGYTPELSQHGFDVQYVNLDTELWKLKPARLKNSEREFLLLSSFHYQRYLDFPGSGKHKKVFLQIFKTLPLAAEFSAKHGNYGFHNPILRLYELEKH